MARPILKPDRKYTFSDYFDLSSPPSEVVKEFGYTLRTENLQFPRGVPNQPAIVEMQALHAKIMPRINLNSEISKREFLIAPVLREVMLRSQAELYSDYSLEVSDKLSGSLDYLLRAAHQIVVIEAKKGDLDKGFVQLAAEMIAVDQYYEGDDPSAELYGAVTIGEVWRFAVLQRPNKLLLRDLNTFGVPQDLHDVLSILLGILQPPLPNPT